MTLPRTLALLLTLCACSKSHPAPLAQASAAPSTAAAAPAPVEKPAGFDLSGTVRGQPVEFRSAVAAKRPHSDALTLIVSTHPRTCKDLEGSYAHSEGESVFQIVVAQGIANPAWHIVDSYYDASSVLGGAPAVDVRVAAGDPAKDVKLTLGELELHGFKSEDKLAVHGTIVAKGCGTVEEYVTGPGAPGPARPQPDLAVTVGGTKLAIVAANYMVKNKRIVLSTSPLSCTTSYSDADVSLLLDADGKSANLQGLRVGGFNDFEPKPRPTIRLGPNTAGEIKATLSGSFKRDDLPVALSGKAQLAVCEK